MKNVLVISGDTIDKHMGGVGVRNWELAHALSHYCQITLAVPNRTDLLSDSVKLISYDLKHGDLKTIADGADVIVLHGSILHFHPYLRTLETPIAVDLYVPNLLESLVWHENDPIKNWGPAYEEYLRLQLELLRAGDFFFCASERQRDYWLGWLHAQKRINPHTYQQDPGLWKLIDIVPFGLQENEPIPSQAVLKGEHPGINSDDKVILWSGGIWDWLDPLTLIRALAEISPRNPQIKLYFMGTHHPNPLVNGMEMPLTAINLSRELGLFGKSVFFGDWVPYAERQNYLAEADLGAVTHPGHIETHFSFRTRVLDYIWAGIPFIITEGDAWADLAKKENVGFTVAPGDVKGLALAIENLITDNAKVKYADSFDKLRQSHRWDKVILPLAKFCTDPYIAPDKRQYLTETERIGRDKDAFLQQVIQDKDAYLEQVILEREVLRNSLMRYQRSLPVRAYHWLKRSINI
jgi:glycosyltransferase involved in cell wall biosynthesis